MLDGPHGEVDEENRETEKEIMLHWETAFQENLWLLKAILAVKKKKKKGLALPLNSFNKASYPWDPSLNLLPSITFTVHGKILCQNKYLLGYRILKVW